MQRVKKRVQRVKKHVQRVKKRVQRVKKHVQNVKKHAGILMCLLQNSPIFFILFNYLFIKKKFFFD